MALYVDPRTGSLRDVIIWIVEELKRLKAQVYKLSQGGGSGGTQNLQETLNNGSEATLFNPVKIVSPLITLTSAGVDSPNTIVVNDNTDGGGGRIWLRSQSGYGVKIDSNNEVGISAPYIRLDTNTLLFKNFIVSNLPFLGGTEYGYATVTDALNPITGNQVIGGGNIVCPVFYDGTKWIALRGTAPRTQGVTTLTLDGMTSVYTIAHGLGQVPSFAYAGRGNSTNFDVFNTTWDSNNITITYENPPIAGTLDVNWIALK